MTTSFYRFACACEKEVETPEPTGTCPNCGRLFDVSAWGAEPVIIR